LISPEALLEDDLLHSNDLTDISEIPSERVDYGWVIPWKTDLLDRSFNRFQHHASRKIKSELDEFQVKHASWLNDFALFMALKEVHNGAPWHTWDPLVRDRDPQAIDEAYKKLKSVVQRHLYRQFLFFRQWADIRAHAEEKVIKIIGDIPIFVAHDSADVWANKELFYLDSSGKPTVVAGVPPDYFSQTGQLWGNPLYNWEIHTETGYSWWLDRIQAALEMVDIVRIDHFRGFAGYWEIPGDAPTAETGRWVPGPGEEFFQTVRDALDELPIIAEDLGVITPDVEALRDKYELPGMKILQFAFTGSPDDPFLPHNYPLNCVVYTGTHDNDTARGWYERVQEHEKDMYRRYMNCDGKDVSWDLIRAIWSSVAVFSLAPMQDFLNLGNEARMNYPGRPSGNWTWRMKENDTNEGLIHKIKEINYLYNRENKD
jgi:4-alpha-glucanotransferase